MGFWHVIHFAFISVFGEEEQKELRPRTRIFLATCRMFWTIKSMPDIFLYAGFCHRPTRRQDRRGSRQPLFGTFSLVPEYAATEQHIPQSKRQSGKQKKNKKVRTKEESAHFHVCLGLFPDTENFNMTGLQKTTTTTTATTTTTTTKTRSPGLASPITPLVRFSPH